MVERPTGNVESLFAERRLPFDVRVASPSDIPALIPLINAAYLYENEGADAFKYPDALRVDETSLQTAFEEGTVIVATRTDEDGERILGCIQYKEVRPSEGSLSTQDANGYFGMLAVDPTLQGQRIGSHLVGLVEGIATAQGHDTMEIQVVDRSQSLLEWYSRLGYERFAQREWNAPFLTKPTQFILMEKNIQPSEPTK